MSATTLIPAVGIGKDKSQYLQSVAFDGTIAGGKCHIRSIKDDVDDAAFQRQQCLDFYRLCAGSQQQDV